MTPPCDNFSIFIEFAAGMSWSSGWYICSYTYAQHYTIFSSHCIASNNDSDDYIMHGRYSSSYSILTTNVDNSFWQRLSHQRAFVTTYLLLKDGRELGLHQWYEELPGKISPQKMALQVLLVWTYYEKWMLVGYH